MFDTEIETRANEHLSQYNFYALVNIRCILRQLCEYEFNTQNATDQFGLLRLIDACYLHDDILNRFGFLSKMTTWEVYLSYAVFLEPKTFWHSERARRKAKEIIV